VSGDELRPNINRPLRPEPLRPELLRPESLISGAPVSPLPPARFPARAAIQGRAVRLEPLDPAAHGPALFAASHADDACRAVWTYLWQAPFPGEAAFTEWLRECAAAADPVFFAFRDGHSGAACGMAAFMRIVPRDGVLEIGHIWFSPAVQRTTASTEALTLMIRHAFDDLGCRRVEWKCDARNVPSRRAALRLGFRFEGIFFRHMIVKGLNRDTAWYSILAEEWPSIRRAYDRWLAPGNFDADGGQRMSLHAAAAGPERA
jgi:RimJ/RimL family protein N-acetyltransferase